MNISRFIKKVALKYMALPLAIKLITISPLAVAVIVGADFVHEMFSGKNNPEIIYEKLEVESMSNLVQIKEDKDGGYYLDFVEDIDDKLDKIIKKMNKSSGYHNVPKSKDTLKDMIKAEVFTQLPDLGGQVPEDSENGFQGAIHIRRVTPNKKMGEMANKGVGEAVSIKEETVNDNVISTPTEEKIKTWQEGKELITTEDAIIYEQIKSELAPDKETGYWNKKILEGTLNQHVKIKKGTKVSYTGNYRTKESALNKGNVTIYVEVKSKDITGYVLSSTIEEIVEQNKTPEEKTSKIEKQKNVTTRSKEKTELAGEEGQEYVIAIAAGHNNTDNTGASSGDLIEQNLTIQVAEAVEDLLSIYSNVKVVQTGSTSENRGGVKVRDRVTLAKNANPDLCIQIHFNAGGGTGAEAIYKAGDGVSQQLAEILSDTISTKMGIKNRQAGPDTEKCAVGSLGIIANSAKTGFPSVVTEGAFLDGDPDASIIKNGGVEKYAQGIVDGILKYLKVDHLGYGACEITEQEERDGIESKITNMKYVTPEKFKENIEKGKVEVLNQFTLDEENKNLITATWEKKEDGSINLKENAAVNFNTPLQKYVMPFEYLLYYYMDTNYIKFSKDLAKEVMKTEIVMAVQDNVTTTKQTNKREEKKTATKPGYGYDWKEKGPHPATVETETCSTKIDITYVDAWCVKYTKDTGYSQKELGLKDNEDEKIVNISGKVTETFSDSVSEAKKIDSGTTTTTVKDKYGEDNVVEYSYKVYERILTNTHEISHQYEDGEATTKGAENKFVKLYQEHEMMGRLREKYLFKIIENNEKTANLLDLTKYLIYKATDDNYGVIEYDFSTFDLGGFNTVGGIYGNTAEEKVWFALRGAGYSEIASAAVMGNIKNESGFEPSKIEGGSGIGFGLCQWSYRRRTKLEEYIQSKGVDKSDVVAQIEFLLAELTPGGGANGCASYQLGGASSSKYDGKRYTKADWENAQDIDTATMAFMALFERPNYKSSVNHIDRRRADAKKYYEEFKGKTAPSGDSRVGTVTLSGDNAVKMMNLLNEAVRIADDDRYTYSQANRYGEFQYDCSSLIARLYKQYFEFNAPNSTGAYGSEYFIGNDGQVELQPGDVLWKPGHVEMYIGNGLRVGAHSPNRPVPDQINVETYKTGYFTKVYRFIQ